MFGRGKVERRWVEMSFLAVRLGGLVTLAFVVLPPGKAVAFLAVELAVFGFYMGFSFAPNHIGMPLVSPKLKLDFLRRQVLMSRNIRGGAWMSIFMGGLNYQVEHHLFPSMARPHLRKAQPLVAAYCAAEGVPYTADDHLAGVPHHHRLPEHRRPGREGPVPLPDGRPAPSALTGRCRGTANLTRPNRLRSVYSVNQCGKSFRGWSLTGAKTTRPVPRPFGRSRLEISHVHHPVPLHA